jgi:pimeloyl-ACP methyl ester carboxylesterase
VRGITSRLVALTAIVVMLAACSGTTTSGSPVPSASGGGASGPAPSKAAATPTPKTSTTPGPGDVVYNGRIDIGGDRSMEVRCVGVGTPTILLEGGGITPSLDEYPNAFVNDLGKTTTTCHYSRAGGGTSSAPTGTRTMAGTVDDAFAMLAALEREANVKGPFVFVGWSFGGSVALAEALARPKETVGLVILDTGSQTDFMTTCLGSGRTKADCQKDYDADIEAKALGDELVKQMHPLPDIPLRLVTAMSYPSCSPADPAALRADLNGRIVVAKDCADLARIYAKDELDGWSMVNPKLEQTLVDADHDGLIDEAGDQISKIILDLVRAAKANP